MYVDGFCYAATQSDDGAHIPIIQRAAIHGIHAVFPPTLVINHKEGKGPFSANKLAAGDDNFNTKKDMRKSLLDLISLMCLLSSIPTHVRELVPDMPKYSGYHDAVAEGAGGIWFSLCDDIPPLVWHEGFPSDIAAEVVSKDTLHGRLMDFDLELAVEVLVVGVALAQISNPKHIPLGTLCDSTPTVSWINKMASKSKFPTARCLLQGLTFMLYCAHAGRLTTVHVPGGDNIMADIAFHPSKAQKLLCADSLLSGLELCSSFDTMFPLPYNQPWMLAVVPRWLQFNVFETLHGKKLYQQQWMGPNGNANGECEKCTAGSINTPQAKYFRQSFLRTGSSPWI